MTRDSIKARETAWNAIFDTTRRERLFCTTYLLQKIVIVSNEAAESYSGELLARLFGVASKS
jgi:hypothetical protein